MDVKLIQKEIAKLDDKTELAKKDYVKRVEDLRKATYLLYELQFKTNILKDHLKQKMNEKKSV